MVWRGSRPIQLPLGRYAVCKRGGSWMVVRRCGGHAHAIEVSGPGEGGDVARAWQQFSVSMVIPYPMPERR